MPKSYYFLLKKSSQIILAVIFLLLPLFSASIAKAQIPNDPKYSFQEPFLSQINAPEAWDFTTGTKSVIVAVLDTGVDVSHPDLKNNIWTNSKEIPNNGIDDDFNGYIDDVHGWNFVEYNKDVSLSVIKNSDDSQAVVHGTILAGLIGAIGNNSVDGVGVNWNASIMPLRVMNSDGGGDLAVVANAVDYAVANGASIISLSIVGDVNDQVFEKSLKDAYKKGVLVISAAGNDRITGGGNLDKKPFYPICADSGDPENWTLGVTSVNHEDQLSSFADYGKCVDLSAPGEGIFSTQLLSPQNGYTKEFDGAWYGTSFSAPLVAGAAALVKSIRPDWGAKEIIADLLSTADDVDGLNPQFIGRMGYGRLNVGRAVEKAVKSKNVSVVEQKNIKTKTSKFYKYDSDKKLIGSFETKTPVKWIVYGDKLIFARLTKGSLSLELQNWDKTNKKLWSVNGVTKLSSLKIGNFWRSGEQVLLLATQNKNAVQFTYDLESQSWRRD